MKTDKRMSDDNDEKLFQSKVKKLREQKCQATTLK